MISISRGITVLSIVSVLALLVPILFPEWLLAYGKYNSIRLPIFFMTFWVILSVYLSVHFVWRDTSSATVFKYGFIAVTAIASVIVLGLPFSLSKVLVKETGVLVNFQSLSTDAYLSIMGTTVFAYIVLGGGHLLARRLEG